jgi:hypothetical protein
MERLRGTGSVVSGWIPVNAAIASIPAASEVIGSYVIGGREEAELAVDTALQAFRETDWKHRPVTVYSPIAWRYSFTTL